MKTLALPKNLDQDTATALSERLQLEASDMRARLENAGHRIAAPVVGDDIILALEVLGDHVAALAVRLGEENPVEAIVHELTAPVSTPAPSPKATAPKSVTEKCRAVKSAKSFFDLPPREPGEGLSSYCARINRGK
jgi:hypothetical protein